MSLESCCVLQSDPAPLTYMLFWALVNAFVTVNTGTLPHAAKHSLILLIVNSPKYSNHCSDGFLPWKKNPNQFQYVKECWTEYVTVKFTTVFLIKRVFFFFSREEREMIISHNGRSLFFEKYSRLRCFRKKKGREKAKLLFIGWQQIIKKLSVFNRFFKRKPVLVSTVSLRGSTEGRALTIHIAESLPLRPRTGVRSWRDPSKMLPERLWQLLTDDLFCQPVRVIQ